MRGKTQRDDYDDDEFINECPLLWREDCKDM